MSDCSPDIVEAKRLIRGLLSYADGHELRGKYADELSRLTTDANNFLKRPGVAQTMPPTEFRIETLKRAFAFIERNEVKFGDKVAHTDAGELVRDLVLLLGNGVAQTIAGLELETENERLREALRFVGDWVAKPPTAFSVGALDVVFKKIRDKVQTSLSSTLCGEK